MEASFITKKADASEAIYLCLFEYLRHSFRLGLVGADKLAYQPWFNLSRSSQNALYGCSISRILHLRTLIPIS